MNKNSRRKWRIIGVCITFSKTTRIGWLDDNSKTEIFVSDNVDWRTIWTNVSFIYSLCVWYFVSQRFEKEREREYQLVAVSDAYFRLNEMVGETLNGSQQREEVATPHIEKFLPFIYLLLFFFLSCLKYTHVDEYAEPHVACISMGMSTPICTHNSNTHYYKWCIRWNSCVMCILWSPSQSCMRCSTVRWGALFVGVLTKPLFGLRFTVEMPVYSYLYCIGISVFVWKRGRIHCSLCTIKYDHQLKGSFNDIDDLLNGWLFWLVAGVFVVTFNRRLRLILIC